MCFFIPLICEQLLHAPHGTDDPVAIFKGKIVLGVGTTCAMPVVSGILTDTPGNKLGLVVIADTVGAIVAWFFWYH